MSDTDDITATYVDRREQVNLRNDPAILALQRNLSPEEFTSVAPQMGLKVGTNPDRFTPFPAATEPESKATTAAPSLDDLVKVTAEKYGQDPGIIRSIVQIESSGNPHAVGTKKEKGLMQLMPETAAELGVTNPFNPQENLDGGTRYFKQLMDRYGGDTSRAILAFNWGMGNVDKWDGKIESLPYRPRWYLAKVTGQPEPVQGELSMGKKSAIATVPGNISTLTGGFEEPGIEGSWKGRSIQLEPELQKELPQGAQQFALQALLNGMSPDEIEQEVGGAFEPIYGPPDLLQDIGSGIISGGATVPSSLATAGLKLAGKEGATVAGKIVAKEIAKQVGFGAVAGGLMAGAESLGGGPIIQQLAGIVGPTAAVSLASMTRNGVKLYLRQLEANNPQIAKKLAPLLEPLQNEYGRMRWPFKSMKAESSEFENDPTALFKFGPSQEMKGLEKLESGVLKDDLAAPTEKYSININHDRINAPEDIHNLIEGVAQNLPRPINAARRGYQSNVETQRLAADLGMSADQLLKRNRGTAFNAEYAVAARWLLVDSAEKVMTMAKLIRSGSIPQNEYEGLLAAFRERLSYHAAIQAQVSGLTAEAGRALQSFKITAEAGMIQAKQIEQILSVSGGKEAVEDMANILGGIADTQGGRIEPSQVNQVVKSIQKPNWRDALYEAWIMGLLSGPRTHFFNVTGNAITALWQIPERKLAQIISGTKIGSGEIQVGETAALWFGMTEGAKEGLRYAGKVMKSGEGSDLLQKIESPRRAFSAEAFNLDSISPLGRTVDVLGEMIRIPGRALQAEDEIFKAMGYSMELHAQAFRQATAEGLRGQAFSDRVGELVMDPDIRAAAIDFGNYITFTNSLGKGGQFVQLALNHIPGARIVVPFFRTPMNILKFAVERSPLAPVMSSWRADIAAGGTRRDLALARISLGSTIMGVAASLQATGQITGAGPADKDMRDTLRRQGWRPYSLHIGEHYIPYNRFDPIGMTLGIAADGAEIMGQLGDADGENLAASAVASISQNLMSKTYLQGVSNFLEVFSQAQREENASRGRDYLIQLIGSTVPSIVNQVTQFTDPSSRDARHYQGFEFVLASLKKRIPGYSKDLPPLRDAWGEVVPSEFSSVEKDSPVDRELYRLKIPLTKPSGHLNGIELEPFEYDSYVQLFGHAAKGPNGRGLKEELEHTIASPDYQRLSENDGEFKGGKAVQLQSIINAYRAIAKAQLVKAYPDTLGQVIAERKKMEAAAMQTKY